MHKLASILGLAAMAGTVSAQQLLVPDSQNFANSGTTTAAWPTAAGRVQWCYDTTHWTNAGITAPVTINRLRFRASDGVRSLGGQVYTGVTVQVGYLNTAAPVLGDYNTMQTAYATNLGVMGPLSAPLVIQLAPTSGSVPNDYVVDIDLVAAGAAFTFDPTTGVDLLIDFSFPNAPVPATNIVAQATSSVIGQRSRRCAGTVAGPGTLSAFAAAVLMDFATTDPGYLLRNGAHVESVGASCGTSAQSFYQLFGTEDFDLRGNPATSFLLVPDNSAAPNFYTVTKGTNAPDLSAKALGTGTPNTTDDGVVSTTPGWTFRFPGGSTTTFNACTNGYVWLGTNTLGDFSPTLAEFLNSTARFCPMWNDHHAGRNTATHPGSGMYIFTDNQGGPGTGRTTVTWKEIGQFAGAAVGGLCVNTFQCRFHENGNVEFRYGSMSSWRNAGLTIVGFSRGGTTTALAADPGSRDLSNEVPFNTQTEGAAGSLPLRLTVNSRPALGLPAGVNLIHTISNMPAATTVQAYILFDWAQQTPGVPLPLGPANCIVSLTAPVTWTTSGISPGSTFTDAGVLLPTGPIPDAGLWMGAVFYIQGITMEFDGVNITTKSTNTLKHTMGLL